MKQREVQAPDGTRWTCVQALAGVDSPAADAAAQHLEGDDGKVPVVCTPSGGAKSVRVQLAAGWEEATSDETLLSTIAAAAGAH